MTLEIQGAQGQNGSAEHIGPPAAHPAQGDCAVTAALDFQAPSKESIQRLQASMLPLRCDMPVAEHFFAPGMYGRRFAMPAGMLVVGKIHKHAHLMMVLTGHAVVITEFGRDEVRAGYVATSQPGAKRVVLAIEDTVFMTVHSNPCDIEDLAQIEKDHIEDENFSVEYHKQITEVLS